MEVVIKGAELLEKWANDKNSQVNKAMLDAIKVTAYGLRKDMIRELRQGGLRFPPTTRSRMNPKKSKNPLAKLAVGVLYKFNKEKMSATIGFHGDTPRTNWTRDFAARSDDSYTLVYTDRMREVLHRAGIHLKKTTRSAFVPARDIISGFFRKYQTIALDRVKDNFRKKLRGERI